MKPIKYAILLLAVLTVCSFTVEAKKIVTVRDYRGKSRSQRKREKEREAKRLREKREKAAKAYKKRREQYIALQKKKKAAADAAEKERAEKALAARLLKEKKEAAAKKTAREEDALLGKYKTMVTEVRMSSIQRAKLIALLKKNRAGKKAVHGSDNRAEIARLTKAYNDATGAKKGIIAAALKDARRKSAGATAGTGSNADQHKQVMGLLTSAQRLKWGGYQLAKDPALKFEGVTLNAKQIKRIRTICDAASKDLPDESGDMSAASAARARKSVLRNVRSQIIFEVVTPEQRAAVQRADAKKRAAVAAASAADK